MIPMMIDAFMNARIADHNSISPRISAMMLMIEVSMPRVRDSPSTKLPPALARVLKRPLRASTIKRMTEPSAWPSHSKKLSTCMSLTS
ncbi:hypothetical protein D3C84_976040 [compost metagenome]